MIIIRLKGDLGNQMFIYALYLSLKNKGKKVYIEDQSYYQEGYNIEDKNINPKLHDAFRIDYLRYTSKFPVFLRRLKDNNHYNEKIFNKNFVLLDGFFQCEKYFDDEKTKEMLRKQFQIPKDYISDKYLLLKKEIDNKTSASIHIRRTDYLYENNNKLYGNICTDEYYDKAIDYIKNKYPDTIFYVFSDDKEYLKEFCEKRNFVPINLNKNLSDVEEMMLMSSCDNNIICNSTFSWWAAWLNNNPNKIIVAPKKWLNNVYYDDIFTDDMIRI